VSKNGLLFNDLTIYENLIYENPEASIDEVENVMKICGIWDKLNYYFNDSDESNFKGETKYK